MASTPLPSQRLLLKLLSYNPDTGELIWRWRPQWMFACLTADERRRSWRAWNKKFEGKGTSRALHDGYAKVRILGRLYFAHRIIWKMAHGLDPICIDHINRIRHDNRLCNLRNVTPYQNRLNLPAQKRSSSGVKGVHWNRQKGQWVASIKLKGRSTYLGAFDDLDAARTARSRAEATYHKIPTSS